jgi:hypothetical protein
MATFVTLGRIYDLMAVVAIQVDPVKAVEILALHENGLLYGAPPAFADFKEEEE